MRKFTLLAAAAFAATGFSTAANAQLVDNHDGTVSINSAGSGGSAVINFNGNSGGVPISGLSGQLTLTFLGMVGNDYSFSYSLVNNSTVTSRLSGFGFNVDPTNPTGGSTGVGSLFPNLIVGGSYPNNVGAIDVCLQDGGGACQGGGNGGIFNTAPNNIGAGTFTLDWGVNVTPGTITLSNFHDRYQSLQVGTGSGTGNYVPGVPEPATWAMMLFGFGAAGVAMRRTRRKNVALAQLA